MHSIFQISTVLDKLLARVNFGKIVQKTFGGLNIGGYHTHGYIYLCKNIIEGLNIGDFIQNCQLPKFTPHQYFVSYDISRNTKCTDMTSFCRPGHIFAY